MPKPAKGARLGSNPAHQKLLLSGLAAALIREERIRTTQAKAMRLRAVADRLVTWGKNGTLPDRRRALSLVHDRDVVHKLFAEISPRYAERNGGYTRVVKLGPRQGDAAPMAIIEFVEGEIPEAKTTATEGAPEKKRRRIRRRGKSEPAAAAPSEEPESAAAEPEESETPAELETAATEPEAAAVEPGTEPEAATTELEPEPTAAEPAASEAEPEPEPEPEPEAATTEPEPEPEESK